MRFASLGSGSRGNGTLVECGATCVLIDCGFSLSQTRSRLARLGKSLDDLTAILVTHEHGDHVRGVERLSRKGNIPVWMTTGTAAQSGLQDIPAFRPFSCHEPFVIDDLRVTPFPVPHDAREPSQFLLGDGASGLGVLTDLGSVTRHIGDVLDGCDALVLECNHDTAMLQRGPYPPSLKQRVGGDHGHLSNEQAAGLLRRIDCGRLQHVVAAHLSDENNTPQYARETLAAALDCEPEWIAVADQEQGLSWRDID